MSKNGQQTADSWEPCAAGTLRSFRRRSAGSGYKPFVVGLGLGVMLAVSAITIKTLIPSSAAAQRPLVCHEVAPLLEAYAADQLDTDRAAQVTAHLAICNNCRSAFEQLAHVDAYHGILHGPPRIGLLLADSR